MHAQYWSRGGLRPTLLLLAIQPRTKQVHHDRVRHFFVRTVNDITVDRISRHHCGPGAECVGMCDIVTVCVHRVVLCSDPVCVCVCMCKYRGKKHCSWQASCPIRAYVPVAEALQRKTTSCSTARAQPSQAIRNERGWHPPHPIRPGVVRAPCGATPGVENRSLAFHNFIQRNFTMIASSNQNWPTFLACCSPRGRALPKRKFLTFGQGRFLEGPVLVKKIVF